MCTIHELENVNDNKNKNIILIEFYKKCLFNLINKLDLDKKNKLDSSNKFISKLKTLSNDNCNLLFENKFCTPISIDVEYTKILSHKICTKNSYNKPIIVPVVIKEDNDKNNSCPRA